MDRRAKLLQVCNVNSRLGGTGACAHTIAQALPEFDHAYAFVNSTPGNLEAVARHFECEQVFVERRVTAEHFRQVRPDVVIWHNSAPPQMPERLPADLLHVYYQHSAHAGAAEARARCDLVFSVSRYLAAACRARRMPVLYQPVPVPPGDPRRGECFTIGRLCTNTLEKWRPEEVVPLYDRLAKDFPRARFEFVGGVPHTRELLRAVLGERATFHEPSLEARTLLWRWNVLLYHASLRESYGRTVVEAQSCGCAPIVTNHGGFVEQITSGVDGFLCDTADGFAAAVRETQARWDAISANAVQSGRERGSLERFRRDFLAWIEAARAGDRERRRFTDDWLERQSAAAKRPCAAVVRRGCTVALRYRGRFADGTPFDEATEPVDVKLGADRLPAALEEGLLGAVPGERRSIPLPAEQAFGARRVDLVTDVERNLLPPHVRFDVGRTVDVPGPGPEPLQGTVVDVGERTVRVDANHPFAGRDVTYDVEIVAVR